MDDDKDVLAFAAEVLNSFSPGFEVATARDLEETILWLGTFNPDLVMVDPKICGDSIGTVTAALNRVYRSTGCKIVVLSNNQEPEWLREQERLGAQAILAKPLRLQELLHTVQSIFGGRARVNIHVERGESSRDRRLGAT